MKKNYLEVVNTAIDAGYEIMKVYSSQNFEIEFKQDNSPLTIADKKSNEIIMNTLKKFDIPIISEENKQIDYEQRKNWVKFWLVDPLDGTKEFINRLADFTVNIALIENQIPVFGVVYVPAKQELFFASKEFGSFQCNNIIKKYNTLNDLINSSQKLPLKKNNFNYKVIASKSHFNKETEDFIEKLKTEYPDLELINVGSSLKLCAIANGVADIYPRFGPTMEWDIAAGHAIVKYAGGKVVQAENHQEMIYNKENLLNPYFIVSLNN